MVTTARQPGTLSDPIPRLCEWVWRGGGAPSGRFTPSTRRLRSFKNVYCQIPNRAKLNEPHDGCPRGRDYDLDWSAPFPRIPRAGSRGNGAVGCLSVRGGGGAIGDWIVMSWIRLLGADLDAPTPTIQAEATTTTPLSRGCAFPAGPRSPSSFRPKDTRGRATKARSSGLVRWQQTIPKPLQVFRRMRKSLEPGRYSG